MKHITTVAALALITTIASADNVKVAVPSNALKASVDKESGRLRHMTDEEITELQANPSSASAKINASLSNTTVVITRTGVGETTKAELGLAVLDELVVIPNQSTAPTHISALPQAASPETK